MIIELLYQDKFKFNFEEDLFNKYSQRLENISKQILDKGIDGIVCSNTTVNHNHPFEGGLSGEELFETSNKNLVALRNFLGSSFPIIASGGVMSRDHFKKKLELGADLVQIYTGMIYKGPALIKEILDP